VYQYDPNGNTISKTTGTSQVRYYWDDEDKMVRLEDSVVMNFKTDGLGFRRMKEVVGQGQTWFVYDLAIGGVPGLSPLVAEYDSNGNLIAKYHFIGGLLAMTQDGQSYWYAFDGIGSSRQLLDQGQKVAISYAFDAWGNALNPSSSSPSVSNPFRYIGYLGYYHDFQDQYLLGVRYYGASRGRFISRDPSRRERNEYVYARNNVVNMVDPTGEIAHWIVCLLPCGCAAGVPLAAILGCLEGGCRKTGTCWECMLETICEFAGLWMICLAACVSCLLRHPHPPHEPPCPPDSCPNGNCPPPSGGNGKGEKECLPFPKPPKPQCDQWYEACRDACQAAVECFQVPKLLACVDCCRFSRLLCQTYPEFYETVPPGTCVPICYEIPDTPIDPIEFTSMKIRRTK